MIGISAATTNDRERGAVRSGTQIMRVARIIHLLVDAVRLLCKRLAPAGWDEASGGTDLTPSSATLARS